LVHQHGIALYDALYLALSQGLNIPLLNADSRLHQRVGVGDHES
jgi:predicted nucleic acid-binding protein